MELSFSIIIPVYNRPDEIDELLESLTQQTYSKPFEVIIVEDGSISVCEKVIQNYQDKLNISYFYKENTGAGLSRNYGMKVAKGNYFIIFDSDCIIPPHYLESVEKSLLENFSDAYGGADAAHKTFTNFQKAINYSMTSFMTTGGLRGKKKAVTKFQPRSFNMGMSKKAFEITGGFTSMKIGEDIDLTFTLWNNNFTTKFISNAFVYHKRRANSSSFFYQTFAFGKTRPLLNKKYPSSGKLIYWFPSLFVIYILIAFIGVFAGFLFLLLPLAIYMLLVFLEAFITSKSCSVAFIAIYTTILQFAGYGLGYLKGILTKKKVEI